MPAVVTLATADWPGGIGLSVLRCAISSTVSSRPCVELAEWRRDRTR